MSKLKSTLLIGSAMGIVVVASVFARPTSPERESLPRRNETVSRSPGSPSPLHSVKESSISLLAGMAESPAPGPRNDPARKPGEEVTKTAPQEADLSDLVARRSSRHAEQEYWEDLGMLMEERLTVHSEKHRRRVMALTTEYLGLDKAQAVFFEQTAVQATLEIAEAWKARNEQMVALPEGLNAQERTEKERQIQERYVAAKEQASGPVGSFLGGNPRHDRFRQKLGEWIDVMR